MSYELIETVEVGAGGAASIEFTSIPQDGTDLVLVTSIRAESLTAGNLDYLINNDTASNYDRVTLSGDGSASDSFGPFNSSRGIIDQGINGSSSTADTFSNNSIYISNYTETADKSISIDSVTENNGTTAYANLLASKYSGSAVSSFKLYLAGGTDLAEYSTASLYKITAA